MGAAGVSGQVGPLVGTGGDLVERAQGHPAGPFDQHLRRPVAGGLQGHAVLGVGGGRPQLEAALDGGLGLVPEADQLGPVLIVGQAVDVADQLVEVALGCRLVDAQRGGRGLHTRGQG